MKRSLFSSQRELFPIDTIRNSKSSGRNLKKILSNFQKREREKKKIKESPLDENISFSIRANI